MTSTLSKEDIARLGRERAVRAATISLGKSAYVVQLIWIDDANGGQVPCAVGR